MTDDQKKEFQQRRGSVMRRHMEADPKIRALRRKRKRSMLASLLGSVVVFAVALLLIKSFMLAVHGPRDFARIISPMVEGQDAQSLAVRLLGPDRVSTEIAALLEPILPRRTQLVTTTPPAPSLPDTFVTPAAAPDT